MENVSLWIKINWKHALTTRPFYRTFELVLVIHVAAEPYEYSYVALAHCCM